MASVRHRRNSQVLPPAELARSITFDVFQRQNAESESEVRNNCLHCCPLCAHKFVNKYSLSRHLKSHHIDDDKFDCRICKLALANYADFLRHLKGHASSRHYACDQCDKTYLTSSDLAKHRLAKHSRPSQQQLRGRRRRRQTPATSSSKLPVSDRIAAEGSDSLQSSDINRPFACQHCDYEATTLGNLRAHELCRHSNGRLTFVCERCGKAFASQCGLLKHRDTHSLVARHACRLCGRRYRHRPTLSRHLRQAHSAAPVLDESMLDLHDLNLNIGTEAAQQIAGEILSCIQDESSLPPGGSGNGCR